MKKIIFKWGAFILAALFLAGCKMSPPAVRKENRVVPQSFAGSVDSTTVAKSNWKEYFDDPNLEALIDTALINNQELNIMLQEIAISKNEIRARKGEYLPFIGLRAAAGVEKEGRYTRHGSVDENLEIKPGESFPDPLPDLMLGAVASWEVDIWKKLRTAKRSATIRYLSTVEGRNFMVTNLIAEIAESYYELLALDNLWDIVHTNITLQTDAFEIVKQQKDAAKLTQLAVNRFEAQLLNTKSLQYEIQQEIIETENKINFLTGRFPRPIIRSSSVFSSTVLDSVYAGIPSQLLRNRPDVRQAELQLAAAKLDVKVARANFYPSFTIRGGMGFQSFNSAYLLSPKSVMYTIAGDLLAPLVNRNAIKAAYYNANAQQVQQVYNYERTILDAYVDVVNQLAKVENFSNSYETKSREVAILMQSVDIAGNLFKSARADYLEVLLVQREALESKMELIELRKKLMGAKVNIYRALGGGWK